MMKTLHGGEFVANRVRSRSRLTRWPALALAVAWIGAATSALGATFGVGAVVDVWDPTTEQPGAFIASDPGGLLTSVQRLLVPEGEAYTAGNTSASISLSRAPGFAGIGTGSATADLALGTLRLYASATGLTHTSSAAGFSDTLTPLASGIVRFTLAVTGVATTHADGSGAFFSIDNGVWMGTRGEVDADGCFGTLNGANSCNYLFDVPVTAGVPFQFALAIVAEANNSSLDLLNTATVRATGVQFTSDSGVFLTAVPEPGAMLLLGFAWAAGSAWHSRRKNASRVD